MRIIREFTLVASSLVPKNYLVTPLPIAARYDIYIFVDSVARIRNVIGE